MYLCVSTTRCSVKGKWSPFDIIAITFKDEEIVAADYMAYAARQGLHKTELVIGAEFRCKQASCLGFSQDGSKAKVE